MDNVFVKRSKAAPSPYAGLPLLHIIGVSPKNGEIGIEIEVEGNKFPKSGGHEHHDGDSQLIPKTWAFTHDGSLRGQDNAEYVLKTPIKFSEVEKAVKDLWSMFDDYGTVLSESNRTSVHVHLNVQQFHLNRLCSFVAMYFVVEELLTSWCGDHRVGNLFCLRGRDAPAILSRLKEFFKRDGYDYSFSSGMHYAGLNPSAIHKFGSVEIRSLRGVNDPQVILDWVSVLERLYVISEDFKDPREVVANFSGNGPIAWLQGILGNTFPTIMNNVPYTTDEVRDILYNGIRLAQDLCYCRDWSEFEEKKVESNPFGRKVKIGAPSSGAGGLSAYATFYSANTVASAPDPEGALYKGYTRQQLMEKLAELMNSATIGASTYLHVASYSMTDLHGYLYNMSVISEFCPSFVEDDPEVAPEDEDEDYEDDYDYEEDDD